MKSLPGVTEKEILQAHPHVTNEDIKAALAFPAQALKGENILSYCIMKLLADEGVDKPVVDVLSTNWFDITYILEVSRRVLFAMESIPF